MERTKLTPKFTYMIEGRGSIQDLVLTSQDDIQEVAKQTFIGFDNNSGTIGIQLPTEFNQILVYTTGNIFLQLNNLDLAIDDFLKINMSQNTLETIRIATDSEIPIEVNIHFFLKNT